MPTSTSNSPSRKSPNNFNALDGVDVAVQVAHFDAEFAVIVGELLRHAFGEGGNEHAFAFLDAVVDFAH